jgi:hypothetical protein
VTTVRPRNPSSSAAHRPSFGRGWTRSYSNEVSPDLSTFRTVFLGAGSHTSPRSRVKFRHLPAATKVRYKLIYTQVSGGGADLWQSILDQDIAHANVAQSTISARRFSTIFERA